MKDCIFCKIVKKQISSEVETETPQIIVIKDIHPKAPVHLLIIPKKHIDAIADVDDKVWIEIKNVGLELARQNKLKGFRLVHNSGDAAAVPHMHVHFLGEVSVDREV